MKQAQLSYSIREVLHFLAAVVHALKLHPNKYFQSAYWSHPISIAVLFPKQIYNFECLANYRFILDFLGEEMFS